MTTFRGGNTGFEPVVNAVDRMLAIRNAADGRTLTNAQATDHRAAAAVWNEYAGDMFPTIDDNTDAKTLRQIAFMAANEQRARQADPMRQQIERAAAENGSRQTRPLAPGEVRALRPEDRIEDLCERRDYGDVGFGHFARAAVTGDWSDIPDEWRFLSVGVGSLGGFTVPEILSSRIVDRARAAAVVTRAGALTFPMTSNELVVPRLSGAATFDWKSEGAAITAGDPTFERIVFRAKTLAALVWMSVELFEDSPTAPDAIETELAAGLAVELDRACMFGSGAANEPLGIAEQTGIGTTAVSGALTAFTNVGTAVRGVLAANHTPDFLAMAPRTWGFFDALADTTDQPLRPPSSFEMLRKFTSTSVPITQGAGSDTTLIVGKGNEMAIGVRTGLRIEVTREGADSTHNAFEDLKVGVRAYLRADFGLLHPAAFHTLTAVSS